MNIIRHTGLVTNDLKKSIFFWCNLVKFKVFKDAIEDGKTLEKVLKIKNVKVRTVKLVDQRKNILELLFFINPKKKPKKKILTNTIGYTHVSITVKDIEKFYKKLKKKKIHFNAPPQLSADGKVKMTYCRTPEGSFLEIVEEL